MADYTHDILEMMFLKRSDPIGQAVFEANTSWTVPVGVTGISIVCVGDASVTVAGSVVCRSNGTPVGSGGNGGPGGTSMGGGGSGGGGGGGGGYGGDGGFGGNGSSTVSPPIQGFSGTGGGGGGGSSGGYGGYGYDGGGVGLKGVGTSGGVSGAHNPGQPGSGGGGIKYGGGKLGATGVAGTAGGNLRYVNNIAVTPGSTVTIAVSNGNWDSGVRFMWGGGRSYPSNAGDM